MSNLATIRQELLDDLHSLVASEVVDRKIISSMRFHRDKRMWFSERTFNTTLTQGRSTYKPGDGLPSDLTEIVGKNLWVLIGGSQDQRQVCVRQTTVEYEYEKQMGTSQAQPEIWDFHNQQLRLYPTPVSTTDQLEGRYVVDIGVPVVKYENGVYKFYAPDGLREFSAEELSNYSNDWTDPRGAAHLIKARTAHLLYKEYLSDPDKATDWLTLWLEHVGLLEDETEARTAGATEIVGMILD